MFVLASSASLRRMPAMRSRSDAVARTAAAAGLFSSCVSPAVSEPRATSFSRCPTTICEFRCARSMPSMRCMAIGNQRRSCGANSSAGSAIIATSVTARSEPG